MQSLGIVSMCVIAAIFYGIVHDQITARICVEYFTIGHPPIFETNDPTLLGIGWGIRATWRLGLLLGVLLAVVSRVGAKPKRAVASLIRPIAILLGFMAMSAIASGVAGWFLARQNVIFLVGPMADRLPADRHVPFIADLWAHVASYAVGFLGGLFVIGSVWKSRGRMAAAQAANSSLAQPQKSYREG